VSYLFLSCRHELFKTIEFSANAHIHLLIS
jgi:hypothetical protein